MTQNEFIWLLVGIIQFLIVGFVSYWTRRVQRLEEVMTTSLEQRTRLLIEYQGRLSRLEEQYTQILGYLARIEKRLDRSDSRIERIREDEEEE